jgi:hypothetical protein
MCGRSLGNVHAEFTFPLHTFRRNALPQTTRRGDFPVGDSKFLLSADMHHTAGGLQKIRLPDVMSSFLPVDRSPDKFCQVDVVAATSQDSV